MYCINHIQNFIYSGIFRHTQTHSTLLGHIKTYVYQSASTLFGCLNIWRHDIWSLSGRNGIRTHNHLLRKRTLNHLVQLAKWLTCVASAYLYRAFDCMILSCHVHILEWICTLFSCLNVKELLARSGCDIWSLSDSNSIQTHSHLVRIHTPFYVYENG